MSDFQMRLKDLEAATQAVQGSVEPAKTVSSQFMNVNELRMFDNQQEIERNSYDLYYEKILKTAADANIPVLDAFSETSVGVLNFAPNIVNTTVFGATSAFGNFIEGFGSREKFVENFNDLSIVQNVKDLGALGADTANLLFGSDPQDVKEARSRRLSDEIRARDEARRNQFRNARGQQLDPDEFAPEEGDTSITALGKRMRAISFYGHLNNKVFNQQLMENADHPLLTQIGGAFGSVSTSALLSTINPKLAMWAIGGHVGANQYLEQVSRGVDWKPALGYGAFIGAGVGQLERMSINILFKKYSSKLALAGDAAFVNMLEEFSQSIFESSVEEFVGAEDKTLKQILTEASFEAALGFIAGGAAGTTSIQMAYNRIDKKLQSLGIEKELSHEMTLRTIAEGGNVLTNMLEERFGSVETDLDIIDKIARGEVEDPSKEMFELTRRAINRQRAQGIDTFLETDPDILIAQQQQQDRLEELQANKQALSLDEQQQLEDLQEQAADRQEAAQPTKVEDMETRLLRQGRAKQINDELAAIDKEMKTLNEELDRRQQEKKPTHTVAKKLGLLNEKIEELLDEAELLPTAQREALASKIVSVTGGRVSGLRNMAEVVAAKIERARLKQEFRAEKKDLKTARDNLLKYVRDAFKGMDAPKTMLTKIARVTPKTLDKFLAEVDEARMEVVRPKIRGRITKVLDSIKGKVKGSRPVGKLQDVELQDAADELIRVSKIDSTTAQALIQQKLNALNNQHARKDMGEIDTEKTAFELGILQQLGGLDAKDEQSLLDALNFIQAISGNLKVLSRERRSALAEKRKARNAKAISEMQLPKTWQAQVNNLMPRWMKNTVNFSVNNLEAMLRSLVNQKDMDSSEFGKMSDALAEAPRIYNGILFKYNDALDSAAKKSFGLKSNRQLHKWHVKWLSDGGLYASDQEIELNNGTKEKITYSRGQASYLWQKTHDINGNVLEEVVELHTNENERNDLIKKFENDEISAEDLEKELANIKGDGLPREVYDEIMAAFEGEQGNVEYAKQGMLLYNTMYTLMNPVYRAHSNITLPRLDNYISWWRKGSRGKTEVYSVIDDHAELAVTTPRSANLRIPGVKAKFVKADDLEVYRHFVQESAYFIGYALPMKDIMTTLRNAEVREAINKTTGGREKVDGTHTNSEAYQLLRGMADQVMSKGRVNNEMSTGILRAIRNNLSIHYLSEPSKHVLQYSSMWMALTDPDITMLDWANGFLSFVRNPVLAFKIMNQAAMMKYRYSNIMVDMKDVADDLKLRKPGIGTKIRKGVSKAGFSLVKSGNMVGAGISGWVIFQKEYSKQQNANAAFRKFDKHIVNTQQSSDDDQLSPIQTSEMGKMVAQFQSALIQYVRSYVQGIKDYTTGRINTAQFARKLMVYHVLMPAMRWFINGLIKGGDFEEEELKRDMALGPLSAIFIVGDIVSALISVANNVHYFAPGNPVDGSVEKALTETEQVFDAIKKMNEEGLTMDEVDFAEAIVAMGEDVTAFTGVPGGPAVPGILWDVIQAGMAVTQDEFNTEDYFSILMGESLESVKFRSKKKKGADNNNKDLQDLLRR